MILGLLMAEESDNKQTDRRTRFVFYKYRLKWKPFSAAGTPRSTCLKIFKPVNYYTTDNIFVTFQVSHVHRQEILLVQQAADNKHLSDQLTQHTLTISDQGKQLSQQSAIIANQTQDIAQLKTCACNHGNNTQPRVLSGVIDCGSSRTWPSSGYVKSVTFSTAYDKKPVVHLSPVTISQYSANGQVLGYTVEVATVTTSSFSVRCRVVSQSSAYRLNDLTVSWVSFPQ